MDVFPIITYAKGIVDGLTKMLDGGMKTVYNIVTPYNIYNVLVEKAMLLQIAIEGEDAVFSRLAFILKIYFEHRCKKLYNLSVTGQRILRLLMLMPYMVMRAHFLNDCGTFAGRRGFDSFANLNNDNLKGWLMDPTRYLLSRGDDKDTRHTFFMNAAHYLGQYLLFNAYTYPTGLRYSTILRILNPGNPVDVPLSRQSANFVLKLAMSVKDDDPTMFVGNGVLLEILPEDPFEIRDYMNCTKKLLHTQLFFTSGHVILAKGNRGGPRI
jgi:hypothetical protein